MPFSQLGYNEKHFDLSIQSNAEDFIYINH